MLPRDLKTELFAGYPPKARALVVNNLPALQQLPLSFLPSLLRESIDYDFKFPVEQSTISRELAYLSSLSQPQLQEWFQGFAQISLSPKLEDFDWINEPGQFVEQQSAYLWSTHQLDAFRKAATNYGDRLQVAVPPEPLPVPRLGIAVVGQTDGPRAGYGPGMTLLMTDAAGRIEPILKAEVNLVNLLRLEA